MEQAAFVLKADVRYVSNIAKAFVIIQKNLNQK